MSTYSALGLAAEQIAHQLETLDITPHTATLRPHDQHWEIEVHTPNPAIVTAALFGTGPVDVTTRRDDVEQFAIGMFEGVHEASGIRVRVFGGIPYVQDQQAAFSQAGLASITGVSA